MQNLVEINGHTIGMVYLTFGTSSAKGAYSSYQSLLNLGIRIPVINIGTIAMPDIPLVPWSGRSPWHPEQGPAKFYAGEIKPFLCNISPFDWTLYIDADTEFHGNPLPGFERLAEFDILGREHEMKIRSALSWHESWWSRRGIFNTIEYLGEKAPLFNTGVMFFRKSPEVRELFQDWYYEWLKFPVWDEQLALMRAMASHPEIRKGLLTALWNGKELLPNQIIRHFFGTGRNRDEIPAQQPNSS
jgi:hypothetical protein